MKAICSLSLVRVFACNFSPAGSIKPWSMLNRFLDFIAEKRLVPDGHKVLLAVSGGMDSMVMANLFARAPFDYAIAHCNFSLRGEASDKDQELVKSAAEQLKVPFFSRKFDTLSFARTTRQSVQMAARQLRYEWLEDLMKKENFDLVATAHHLDDSIETLLINISRGTGLSGLKGIPIKSRHIIRPLLFATKEEIENYARAHEIKWREDLSNRQEHYLRNKLRLQVIPVLKEINPSLTSTLSAFFERMDASHEIFMAMVEQQKKTCLRFEGKEMKILIPALLGLPRPETFLYEFIRDFGFSPAVCHEVFQSLEGQPGKVFASPTHIAIKDRDQLLIGPKEHQPPFEELEINPDTGHIQCGPFFFRFEVLENTGFTEWPRSNDNFLADFDKLEFPLRLRPWKAGDRITPLGMKGSKKVSDLLVDEKIPLSRKKNIMVLLSGESIAWVAGVRSSEQFRVAPETNNIFRAKIY